MPEPKRKILAARRTVAKAGATKEETGANPDGSGDDNDDNSDDDNDDNDDNSDGDNDDIDEVGRRVALVLLSHKLRPRSVLQKVKAIQLPCLRNAPHTTFPLTSSVQSPKSKTLLLRSRLVSQYFLDSLFVFSSHDCAQLGWALFRLYFCAAFCVLIHFSKIVTSIPGEFMIPRLAGLLSKQFDPFLFGNFIHA